MKKITQTEVQAATQLSQQAINANNQHALLSSDATLLNQTKTYDALIGVNSSPEETIEAETKVAYKPKVCFLFGAGAELYYGMPTGARFAIDIFKIQAAGQNIFDTVRKQLLDGFNNIDNNDLSNEQQRYKELLQKHQNESSKDYILSKHNAYPIIRETIKEHYKEIINEYNKYGTSKSRVDIWVLEQLQNDYHCNLHIVVSDFCQILNLTAPSTPKYNKDKDLVKWAKKEIYRISQDGKKSANANRLSQTKYITDDYAIIDKVWDMPLFVVLFNCTYQLNLLINNQAFKENILIEKGEKFYNDISNEIELAKQATYGIHEIIIMAVIHDTYVNKHKLLFSDKVQVIPTHDSGTSSFEINFDEKLCPCLLELMFSSYYNPIAQAHHYKETIDRLKSSHKTDTTNKIDSIYNISHTLAFVCLELFYTISSNFISYKSLIDNLWRYLYEPDTDWGKFTQISCFLLTTQFYISSKVTNINKDCKGTNGYYEQVRKAVHDENLFELGISATTNYASLIKNHLFTQEERSEFHNENYYLEHPDERKLAYLNGSTFFKYDPYFNELHEDHEENVEKCWTGRDHINVPLLFTQSGTKAMTVVEINNIYTSVLRGWLNSDAVVLVGFNCSKDDIHINGMIRKFLQLTNRQKPIVIVTRAPQESPKSAQEKLRKEFAEKLHLDKKYEDCLLIIGITNIVNNQAPEEEQQLNNTDIDGVVWYKKLHQLLSKWHNSHPNINDKKSFNH